MIFKYKKSACRSKDGAATVIFTALLAIMALLLVANGRALIHLRREIQLLDKHQIKRLEASQTNVPAILPATDKSGPP